MLRRFTHLTALFLLLLAPLEAAVCAACTPGACAMTGGVNGGRDAVVPAPTDQATVMATSEKDARQNHCDMIASPSSEAAEPVTTTTAARPISSMRADCHGGACCSMDADPTSASLAERMVRVETTNDGTSGTATAVTSVLPAMRWAPAQNVVQAPRGGPPLFALHRALLL